MRVLKVYNTTRVDVAFQDGTEMNLYMRVSKCCLQVSAVGRCDRLTETMAVEIANYAKAVGYDHHAVDRWYVGGYHLGVNP